MTFTPIETQADYQRLKRFLERLKKLNPEPDSFEADQIEIIEFLLKSYELDATEGSALPRN